MEKGRETTLKLTVEKLDTLLVAISVAIDTCANSQNRERPEELEDAMPDA